MFLIILATALAALFAFRMRIGLLAVAAIVLVMTPGVAQAGGQWTIADVPEANTVGSLALTPLAVMFLLSAVIPILTGLVTKYSLPALLKGLITLVLNFAASAITQAATADGGAFFSQETLIFALLGMSISVAMYLGIYEKADLTSSKETGKLFPSVGLGARGVHWS